MLATQIPVLNQSPPSFILLISSLSTIILAPTHSLYISTKATSLTLYQPMSIEHQNITFTVVIPATMESDLWGKALDADAITTVPLPGQGLFPCLPLIAGLICFTGSGCLS